MVEGFYKDLEQARGAEALVAQILKQRNPAYEVEEVGDQRQYYHKGDIKITTPEGRIVFFEVKNDGCIWKTKNVLCEEEVYYKYCNSLEPGNMYSDYEIYTVVNEHDRIIYFIDFEVMKRIYKKLGKYKQIPHSAQTTYAYLLYLADIKREGALLKELRY